MKGDSQFMKKFIKEFTDVSKLLKDTDKENVTNKNSMKDLSTRNLNNDDYFTFIIDLVEEQQGLDVKIVDTKKKSDEVLKRFRALKLDFEQTEQNMKDQILFECRKQLSFRLNSLPDLEEKLRNLETRLDA